MAADFPAVQQPELVAIDSVPITDSTPIVGVELDGRPVAFVLDAMSRPDRHIISTMIGNKPIAVTYCDLADCVRVLTDRTDRLIPLTVAGLDDQNQMVFQFGGQLYRQSSGALPLQDYPHARMDFGRWRKLHPKSMVYVGDRLQGDEA